MNPLFDALLNGLWQGITVTALVWLVMRDLPRLSAATRLAIWHVTLAVVLLLPLLQRIPLPRLSGPATASGAPSVVWETPEHRAAIAAPAPSPTSAPAPAAAVPAPRRPVFELPHDVDANVFLAFAFLVALFQLARLPIGYWVIRRLKRKSVSSGIAAPMPVSVRRQAVVLLSDRVGMPMALGYRRPAIILPSQMAARLSPSELNLVLLHESAHLARRDDWTALGERVLRALFYWHPAVHWICRQIEKEREMACDDWVVAQSGETKPYAAALARVAELGNGARGPLLATGAGRPKAIFARLEGLLDRTRNRLPSVSEPLVMLAGLALLLVVYQGAQFNHLFGSGNFSSRWVETSDGHRRELKMRGNVRFNTDDTDLESMSPGSLLVVHESDVWSSRTVEFEAGENGTVDRRYFKNGNPTQFGPEARKFVAAFLPEWLREQGVQIPERLARDITARGADGALEQIRTIRTDWVKRRYLEEFFEQTEPSAWQLSRALRLAGEMGSDHEKRQFFERVRSHYEGSEHQMQALAFVDGIQSDYERSQLLGHAIEHAAFGEALPPRLLRSVGRLASDDSKANLLGKAAGVSQQTLPPEFFDAAQSVASDGAREHLLMAALGRHGEEASTVARALRAVAGMGSDHNKANVVSKAAVRPGFDGTPDVVREAARALGSIHSDNDRRRALEAILRAPAAAKPATQREVFLQTASMGSDHEKVEVLIRASTLFGEGEETRQPYFAAVNSIHSSHDQQRVLMAVLARSPLGREVAGEVERAAQQIGSSNEQAQVLKALAARR